MSATVLERHKSIIAHTFFWRAHLSLGFGKSDANISSRRHKQETIFLAPASKLLKAIKCKADGLTLLADIQGPRAL